MRAEASRVTILEHETIHAAVKIIDQGGFQIALVVNGNGQLKGTITDGDVRRGLLRGVGLEDELRKIMNSHPIVAGPADQRDAVVRKMRQMGVRQLPVVDAAQKLLDLEFLDVPKELEEKNNWAILMAGGLGLRLRPLTEDLPKPLIPIGGKPILEIALENLISQGIRKFFISVNYLAGMIKAHFGDGSNWGVEISYLYENKEMGTAGALGLLPSAATMPFLVMNGDIMTSANIPQMLAYHEDMKASITAGVFTHEYQVPYGVMELDENLIRGIQEKPSIRHFVNAGVYVLSPDVLEFVNQDEKLDMPNLIELVIGKGMRVAAFPIHEYWIDIGRHSDLQQAERDVDRVFGDRRLPVSRL